MYRIFQLEKLFLPSCNSMNFRLTNRCSWESVASFWTENVLTWEDLKPQASIQAECSTSWAAGPIYICYPIFGILAVEALISRGGGALYMLRSLWCAAQMGHFWGPQSLYKWVHFWKNVLRNGSYILSSSLQLGSKQPISSDFGNWHRMYLRSNAITTWRLL